MAAAIGLPALGGVIAVLALLALAAPFLPRQAAAPATAGLCGLALVPALGVLLAGGRAQAAGGTLAIDGLGAFFALVPAVAGLAAAGAGLGSVLSPRLPALAASGLLLAVAGDAPTAVLAAAVFALAAADSAGRGAAIAGVFLLALALAVLAGAGVPFAAMRAAPPDGWRAAAVLAAAVPGVALLCAGCRAQAGSPAMGAYLLARLLLDLCGPATPGWWGLPLLLAGGVLAVCGAAWAGRATGFGGVLSGLSLQHAGWMQAALGAAAVARAVDLLPLTALAVGGALLHALGFTLAASLAWVSAGAAEAAAGSRLLDRMGGLARGMPVSAAAILVAGLGLALLPPSLGFASGWTVLQALLVSPRIGGLPLQLLLAATVLALAASAGLGLLAVVRMVGVGFLGRPRTPRAAAAEEGGPALRRAMLGLIAACVLAGLLPGPLLLLADPAVRLLAAAGLDGVAAWAGLHAQSDTPVYGPVWLVLLAGAGLTGLALLVRTGRLRGPVAVPAWDDGFAAPPAWMPFGDPATQADLRTLALPAWRPRAWQLPRLRVSVEGSWPAARPAAGVALLLAALVAALAVVAVATPA